MVKKNEKSKIKKSTNSFISKNNGIIYLDLKRAKDKVKKIKYNDLCDTAIYVPLETRRNCIINANIPTTVVKDGDDIFICNSLSLYHFDINGKFINQYGKKGRGPGEYCCNGFCVDKKGKYVYAFGNYSQKIYKYSYDGKFISSIYLGSYCRNLIFNSKTNGFVSCSSYYTPSKILKNPTYNIIEDYDKNGVLKNKISSNYYGKGTDSNKLFDVSLAFNDNKIYTMSDSRIMVQEFSNDTLFEYKNKKLVPRIITNNREFNKRFSINNVNTYKDLINNLETSNYAVIRGESSRFLIIRGEKNQVYIYDKKNSEFNRVQITSKYFDCINVAPIGNVYDNNFLLSVISANRFIENTKNVNKKINNSIGVFSNRIQSIRKNLTEESNPVLLIYRLRK
ncbi:6-bladed beta-propeller [Marinilabiliaceae bacterium JC040]|nr:6-bladed beta-propeller [Marinilabiliaceae bacterium JC040]